MLLWVATPVVSSKVWEKVSYIDRCAHALTTSPLATALPPDQQACLPARRRVRDLYDYFDADQVLLPKFVYECAAAHPAGFAAKKGRVGWRSLRSRSAPLRTGTTERSMPAHTGRQASRLLWQTVCLRETKARSVLFGV